MGTPFGSLATTTPCHSFPTRPARSSKWAPILEELNRYTLKVVGLKPGKYEVRLGGKEVAHHDADALAQGVNLADAALSAGPVADQVKAVKAAVEAKNKYHHDRVYRGVVLAQASVPDWLGIKMSSSEIEARRKAAFEERMAKMPELDAAARKPSNPAPTPSRSSRSVIEEQAGNDVPMGVSGWLGSRSETPYAGS